MNSAERAEMFRSAAERFGPWITHHKIDDIGYGGRFDYSRDSRLLTCLAQWRPAGRILEFGCNEGGHTAVLAAQPDVTHLHAVDARDYLVEKTRVAVAAHGFHNVTVSLCNADDPAAVVALGLFDGVFCSGLLYHLQEPWLFLAALRRVTSTLFISTHYTLTPTEVRNGYDVQPYQEKGFDDAFSGMRAESVWPCLSSLRRMIEDAGFTIASLQSVPEWSSGLHSVRFPLANILCR